MVMQVRRTLTVGATPTGLAEGQISVGMADQPPIAWVGVPASVNPAGVIPITGLVRTVAGAPQPAGALGQLWWDEDAAQLFVYTGSEWVVANNPPIPDLSGFATKSDLDDYLPLTGGTLTGDLALTGDLTVGGEATFSTPAGGGNEASFGFGWFPAGSGAPAGTTAGTLSLSVNGAANGYIVRSAWQPGTYANVNVLQANSAVTEGVMFLNGAATCIWSVTACDERVKRDAVPAGDALAHVDAIPVYSATYIPPLNDGAAPERWSYTLMAQQVAERLPFAYMHPPENGYASLHPLHLIATLWRAVQQLSEQVKTLEAKP